jgi:exodeoxyribonuclease V beta subunit
MNRLRPLEVDPTGLHLIEASAGTGKTHTIGTLLLRLVIERGLAIERILVVTFTEAATADLRRRLRQRLRQAFHALDDRIPLPAELAALCPPVGRERARTRVWRALLDFDCAPITTIHGFCLAMLQDFAFESGLPFDVETEAEAGGLIEEVVDDFRSEQLHRLEPLIIDYLSEALPKRAALIRLAERVLARPDCQPLPAKVERHPDPVGALQAAHRQARALWLAQREEIAALVCDHEGLHKGWFKPQKRLDSLAEMERLLAPERAECAQLPAGVGRLTPAWLAAKCKKGRQPPVHPFFEACQRLVDAGAAFEREALASTLALIEHLRREVPRRRLQRNIQSFDDLLQRLDQALAAAGGATLAARIRERCDAALVDEFQDTDRVQVRIFEHLFGDGALPVFLVGDPKQSIYGFRGADINAYLEAAGLAAERHTLAVNWRSSPPLLAAIDWLFGRAERAGQRPFVDPRIRHQPVEPQLEARNALEPGTAPLQLRFLPRADRAGPRGAIGRDWIDAHLADWVAGELVRLLNDGPLLDGAPIRPGQVAVLVRTNDQAARLQQALQRRRVPAVLSSAGSVFATREAEELSRVLAAAAEPTDSASVRAALATDLLGFDAAALDAMAAADEKAAADDRQRWADWQLRFRDWHRCWQQRGFMRLARALLLEAPESEAPPVVRLAGLIDGERRVTNLLHLAELLHGAAAGEHLGPRALLRWFEQKRAGDSRGADSEQLRLESDARAVQLVTVHRSKGLQYPVVVCPSLWDVRRDSGFPLVFDRLDAESGRARSFVDLHKSPLAENVRLARRETLAEAMRLTYVALTRAEQLCLVLWGGLKDYAYAPLARLLHLPGAPDDLDALGKAIGRLDDQQLFADLQALAAESDGTIAATELAPPDGAVWQPEAIRPAALGCAKLRRRLQPAWAIHSFSSLKAGQRRGPDVAASPDHDQDVEPAAPPAVAAAEPEPLTAAAVERIPLADLERGPRMGDCLHALLEQVDFAAADDGALDGLVARQRRACGLDAVAAAGLRRAVDAVLDTPLDGPAGGLRLRGLPARRCLRELEFLLPAAGVLEPAVWAADLRTAGGPAIPDAYPERLAAMAPQRLEGFLRGFIDLVFVHDDRWFVVDYKSNFLGERFADYRPERLAAAMAEHDYFLQYLLYCVALERILRYRLADFDPERHLGGVYYLFVRGLHPDHGPRWGVFRDRPSPELLQRLGQRLGLEAAP